MPLNIDAISMLAKDLNLHHGIRLQALDAAFVLCLGSKIRCIRPFLVRTEHVAQAMNLGLAHSKGQAQVRQVLHAVCSRSQLPLKICATNRPGRHNNDLSSCQQCITPEFQQAQTALVRDGQNLHVFSIWCQKKRTILK
jgi:hypothetical protein